MTTLTKTNCLPGLALLVCFLLIGGNAAAGSNLPAAAQRIWAPTGDLLGTANHATATVEFIDSYGDQAKTAEDWQWAGDEAVSGLFNWQDTLAGGYRYGLRGAGTTATGEGPNGHLGFWGARPGRISYALEFRTYDQFSDRTSERRAATFGLPPAPPALATTPILGWQRSDLRLGYRLNEFFSLKVGARSVCRDGDKGSLLRGATGSAAPNLKNFAEGSVREAWLGMDYQAGALAADLTGTIRTQGGDRTLGTAAYADDRTAWRTALGVQWNAATDTRVLGFGSVSGLQNNGSEELGGVAVATEGETSASAGQLGLIQALGRNLTLRAAANFRQSATEAASDRGTTQSSVDRDRSSQEYRLHLTHTGLARTRLDLDYRLRSSKREQVLIDGATFTTDEDKTTNALVFKARHRTSRTALLRLEAGWSQLEREQTRDWDDAALAYWLDDYKRSQFDTKLGLQTRPHDLVRLDVGHQLIDRTFENQLTAGVETAYRANRGYANLNWNPRSWLTLYGMVSVGQEQYELGDGTIAPEAGMGAVNHDATAWRYVPGAVVQLTTKLQAEASWEGVRYEDTADTGTDPATGLIALQSDHDRVLVRLGYAATDEFTVSATYRRHEFAEQRWDNYIHDLYGLSISGRF